MKAKLILFVTMLIGTGAFGQVLVQLQPPPAGLVSKESLWNLTLVSQAEETMPVSLRLSLQDAAAGQIVLSATTGSVFLRRGARLLSARDLGPLTWNGGAGDYSKPFLPLGVYNACYQVFRNGAKGEELLGEECMRVLVEPLSPPMLASPADGSEIDGAPSFSWTAPAPATLFSGLSYDLVLVELLPGQTPAEAVQNNIPLYSRGNLSRTGEIYPPSGMRLDTARTYAWQVVARNASSYAAKTEAWTFRVRKDGPPEEKPSNIGYILLSASSNGVYTLGDRSLKVKLLSYLADYTGRIVYTDDKGEVVEESRLAVHAGENYFDLRLRARFHRGRTYALTLYDPEGRPCTIRFTLR